jgi:cytidine deaminase
MINLTEDLRMARIARNNAKSKSYTVGAVLKCKNGNRYVGCNIENQGIQSMCAERVAFAKAISEGETEFDRILIVGAPKDTDNLERCLPCGYCRQFMQEYAGKDLKVYTAFGDKVEEYTMEELLPYPFGQEKE